MSPECRRTSSAAAITASGLFQLAKLVAEPEKATHYRDFAVRIMTSLLDPEFLADQTPGWEGILKHGSYHERLDLGVDESVMWGEYFFVEALDKLLGAPAVV
jgi:unsaturated chondroitin disaccharide hydrolase